MTDSPACVMVDGDRETPVYHSTPEWHASLDWARFHGIDPCRVPAGAYIERDPVNRRILYVEFVMAEDGGPLIVEDDVVTVGRVQQGEAPPLPFPVIA